MKKNNFLKIAMLFSFAITANFSYGQLVTTIDFETENDGYTLSDSEGSGFTDVFNRIDRTGDPLGGNSSFLFAIEDLNTVADPSIQLDQIDVSGSASFTFSINMLAHHYNDWDNADELLITYSVDGGADQNLMWVQSITDPGSAYNEPAALDTNFDGDGECGFVLPSLTTGTGNLGCVVSTSDFATFITSSIVLSSNSTLDIKLQFNGFTAGDEGMYLDNIIITETSGSSDPTIGFDAATSSQTETDATFNVSIPITVSNYGTDQIDLSVAVSGAAEVADYTLNTASLSFTEDGSQNISLDINPDSDDFDDEEIILTITETSSVTGLVISQATHTVTVTEDETAPTIGFDAATSSQTETDATFTVTIPLTVANYSGTQIDVSVASSGTAEGGDFTLNTASLSFTADGSQNISLDINDDADTDGETVILTITETSAVTGLTISQSQHTVTITDDEAPVFSVEDFTNSNAAASYTDNNFVGNNEITWSYIASRDEDSDNNAAGIDGKAIMLRDLTNGSKVTSSTIPGGIGNFSVKLYKGFTGGGDRQVELFINNVSKGTSIIFDDADDKDDYTFTVDAINVAGDISIEVRNISGKQVIVDDISWTAYSPTVTWDGSDSSDWATVANWDTNTVPTATDNVIIPDVDTAPIIGATTGAVTNDLTITEAEGINITAGGSLIVSGTSSGNITYNVSVPDDKWHLVSSPVVGEVYDDNWANDYSIADGSGTNRGISTYQNGTLDTDTDGEGSDTSTGSWVYMLDGETGTFASGTGYSLKRTSSGTYSFTGTFPTAPITTAITQDVTNWNLIGNPYPSYIDIPAFITANSASLGGAFQNIYVWNASTNSYTILTTGYIYPGQAFFVNSNVASGNTSITAVMQSHQTGVTFYKTESTAVINLNLTSGDRTKSTQINYLENKTTGLDPRFDIGMFDGVASDIRIYTHLISNNEGISFQRQALPNSDLESMVIPVGVNAKSGKEITFTTEALNLPMDIKVFLEDRLTNTFTRLDETNSEYKITLTDNLNGVGRFYIHTTKSVLSAEDVILNSISIYTTNSSTLKIAGLPQGKASFSLYNILGKEMIATSFTSNGNKEISLSKLASGVYLAKVQTAKGAINKKIILE